MISGLQGGADPRYKKVVADCKHFAAYDMENSDGTDRHHFSAQVSLQDLVEYYLPSFESCIRDAQVGSIMCSYNAVNGVPSCANSFLLQTIAREHWGMDRYDGWVTSDCDAVADIYNTHKFTSTPEQSAADALLAGTDVDCGGFYTKYLPAALNQSLISEADLDRALIRQYSSLIQLGYFDDAATQPYRQLSWNDVNTEYAKRLAHIAALESVVLVKNDGTLPLATTVKSIALIGPWANATTQMQGNYYGHAPYLISPLLAFQSSSLQVTYAAGCAVASNDTSHFDDAIKAAMNADVIVFAGGIDISVESESHDRVSIEWPGQQLPLIMALEKVGKPIVVLQFGGGQVDDSYLKSSATINAVIWMGYPGQSGGRAVVDVVTGAYAPAGRLPITQYPAQYTDQVMMTDMTLRPSATSPGRTYKWFNGQAVYTFGHGLHYTSFSYAWTQQSALPTRIDIAQLTATKSDDMDKAPFMSYAVNVTNTGAVASDIVVLLFTNTTTTSAHPNAPAQSPTRELIAYERAHLIAPGESRTVYFTLTLRSISRIDAFGHRWLFPGKYRIFVDNDASIQHTVELTGEAVMIREFPQPKAKTNVMIA